MVFTTHQPAKQWTLDEYDRLVASGVLGSARVELIGGQLYPMTPADPPHDATVTKIRRVLERLIGDAYHVREEKSLTLSDDTVRLPDLMVVPGEPDDYVTRRPDVTDAMLVGEVSDSTLATDRREKADQYAAARVGLYWLINLAERQLEVRQTPARNRASKTGWRYADTTILGETKTVTFPLAGTRIAVPVADLLPRHAHRAP